VFRFTQTNNKGEITVETGENRERILRKRFLKEHSSGSRIRIMFWAQSSACIYLFCLLVTEALRRTDPS
jgi:hypothetical protein